MVSKTRSQKLIAILTGPTACGKTRLSIEFAKKHSDTIEIVNADSLLFYKYLNIGTAKPTADILQLIPHHLIDISEPYEPLTAGDFFKLAEDSIQDIYKRGKLPMFVGGSGFYLKALVYGLWEAPKSDALIRIELEKSTTQILYDKLKDVDPERVLSIGLRDRYRIIRSLEIWEQTKTRPSELRAKSEHPREQFELLILDNPSVNTQIERRTDQMLNNGLIDETKMLFEKYGMIRPLQSVGYKQVIQYLKGVKPEGRKIDAGIKGLRSEVVLATQKLVKKQRTWMKGMKHAKTFLMPVDENSLLSRLKQIYEL